MIAPIRRAVEHVTQDQLDAYQGNRRSLRWSGRVVTLSDVDAVPVSTLQ